MTNGCQRFNQVFIDHAKEVALIYRDKNWSYTELLSESWRRVKHWQNIGLAPGDRVLLYLPEDRLEFIFAVLAGSLGGFELVAVSQKATPDEVKYIRNITQPNLEWCVALEDSHDVVVSHANFNDVRLVFFTSGTTDQPKGICHDFEKLLSNANDFNKVTGLDSKVRMMHVMPVGYMAGLLNTFISPFMAGGSVILAELFDVQSALNFWSIAQYNQINAVWLTPTMVATLTTLCRGEEITEWARANLSYVFVGTAPLYLSIREAFQERVGVKCLNSYGMTECMFISVCPPDIPDLENSVGLLLTGVNGQVRDSDSNILQPGQEGNIWVKSEYVLVDHLNTDNILSEDGWLDTGDIGIIDIEERIVITGRKKDLIIHGGTNISPKQVEEVLLKYSGIKDVAVIGVPHDFWGEEVLAYLILEPGISIKETDLSTFCEEHLNSDSVPSRILLVDEFPRSNNGKILKNVLKQFYIRNQDE